MKRSSCIPISYTSTHPKTDYDSHEPMLYETYIDPRHIKKDIRNRIPIVW